MTIIAKQIEGLTIIKKINERMGGLRWCTWKYIERGQGKKGKIPHSGASGGLRRIGCDDVSQWGGLTEAEDWLNLGGDGIGFLVGSNSEQGERYSSGLVALDIDDCLGEDGQWVEGLFLEVKRAYELLCASGVYFEVSPSGRGLRGLWIGEKPNGIKEKVKVGGCSVELYDGNSRGRFVTVTGNPFKRGTVGGVGDVCEVADEVIEDVLQLLGFTDEIGGGYSSNIGLVEGRNLEPISDQALVVKIKQSARGKGKKLYEGDTSEHSGDWSSADLALCVLIARYTDDTEQIERIWETSGLSKRDKFRKRKDYRTATVVKALEISKADALTSKENAQKSKVKEALAGGDNANNTLAEAIARWGGKIPNTFDSVVTLISQDKRLAGAFAYDEFTGCVSKLMSLHSCLGDVVPKDDEPVLGDIWSDADTSSLLLWLGRVWGCHPRKEAVNDAILLSAKYRRINTVCDRLEALHWDGIKRLDSMLVDYLSADNKLDPDLYLSEIGKRWMIGAVKRAFEPGTKMDNLLVLDGGQGLGKSNAVRTLACAIAPHTFMEGLPSLSNGSVEAERSLKGKWLCELAELAFMDKAASEGVKAFLTKQIDTYRSPFDKHTQKHPRTIAFAATTNQSQFVNDTTGARRFWTFTVGSEINNIALAEVADQLWAEAVVLFKAGEPHWLTNVEAIQQATAAQQTRLTRNGDVELIEEYIVAGLRKEAGTSLRSLVGFRETALNLFKMIPSNEESSFSKNSKAFSNALLQCGFVKSAVRSGNKSWYEVGELLLLEIQESLKS